jgi:hypothetical protein
MERLLEATGTTMRLIFCSDPLDPRRPDPMYAQEVAAASGLGIAYSLMSFEALLYEQNEQKAVRRVEPSPQEDIGIYRGWMLRLEHYARLYTALTERGIRLVNTPSAYRHCHHLPESYSIIESSTPTTVWMPVNGAVSMEAVMRLLEPFGAKPIIVKDYVKSQKHKWAEACFIPSAADREDVERVVGRFLQLQGDDLNEGLVFREYMEFEPLATHSKSGMPLTKEYRLFYLDGEPILTAPYWEQGDYSAETLPRETFSRVAQKVQSRFFTMDVAKLKDGEYMVVELGDAQVAGLPERADPVAFYTAIWSRLQPAP